jgi:hypothetical protein
LRCFDRAGEAAISLFLQGTALNNPTDHYVDPGNISFLFKEAPESGSNSYPRAPSPPASAGVVTQQEIVPRRRKIEKSCSNRIDHDAGYDLRTGACGHGRTESAILARSDRPLRPSGGTRFQCYRSADGAADDGAQCAPLSWRTEIQRLIPYNLERLGTTTLVGLPSSAAKKRPQLGGGSWGRSLKVPVGDRHDLM